ncbi:hypothetical protein EC957_008623 [Mortierella hygrophila]|uniref:Uncharacterized protein n=1 Tax=Mortierella hygrophila TaxID=979708 RepID=A0A9P6K5S9_9FUNG|nr:hypothetical protein EC957_008623 [Mortierella hygrophila]
MGLETMDNKSILLPHNANQSSTDEVLDEQDTAELLENLPGFIPDDDDDVEQDTETGVKNEDVTLFPLPTDISPLLLRPVWLVTLHV